MIFGRQSTRVKFQPLVVAVDFIQKRNYGGDFMKNSILPALFGFALISAVPVYANSTSFNFTSPTTGTSGVSTEFTYTIGSLTFSAYGYTTSSVATALFAKNTVGNPGETGLGIANDPTGDDEIYHTTFVQLDLSALRALGATTVLLDVGSLSTPDAFQFYTSTVLGTEGTADAATGCSGNGSTAQTNGVTTVACTITLPSTGNYYVSLGETTAPTTGSSPTYPNVVLAGGTINYNSPTPEPATFGLLGLSLVGLGWIARKRKLV
jgi:hypothetical protein